jgi:microsomal dipeptidase-like Zn-dependent dipeptidase
MDARALHDDAVVVKRIAEPGGVIGVAGVDHVGLGPDFSEPDVRKILGENVLRVLRE